VQAKNVNSNATEDMFLAFTVVHQIITELSGTATEKEKVALIAKAVLRLLKDNANNSSVLKSILILFYHPRLGLSSGFFPSGFLTKNPIWIPICPHACYMSRKSHPPGLVNSIWQIIQVMKLFVKQFSPISNHFILLQSRYSLQHPVLKYRQSMFFL
jgi:hypothetical protein